jgi:hypothetical protein
MTLTATTVRTVTGLGNGVTTDYTIGFSFQANNQIEVYVINEGVTPHTITPLVYGVGAGKYTITGGDPGLTVVMGTPMTATKRAIIQRATPKKQTVDYSGSLSFPADDHEEQMDRVIASVQEIADVLSRCLRFWPTSTLDPTFPAELVAGSLLVVNSTNTGLTAGPSLSAFDADVAAAAASAAAAAASQATVAASTAAAAASATAASASQTAAATSATNAATSQAAASGSAAAAAASQTAAATSATNASASAAAAAASEAAAAGYVGAAIQLQQYANDAAYVAANGAATNGDLYYNTTTHRARYYKNGAWTNITDDAIIAALTAAGIAYSNATSGLVAANVQTAIDEVEGRLDTAQTTLTSHTATLASHSSTLTTHTTNIATNTAAATQNASDISNVASGLAAHISDPTVAHWASAVGYVNGASGLAATDVQGAIDEIAAGGGGGGGGTAAGTTYSNASSGLAATDVQAAIDEVEARLDTAQTNITTGATNLANHLADAVDAHDASAISYVNTTSGLAATDVQAAIDEIAAAGGAGEANTGANVGAGTGTIFRDKTGVTLNLKTLIAGAGLTLTNGANDITLAVNNIGVGNHVYVDFGAGNDVTGSGKINTPYQTIAKALSVITTASAANPFTIYVLSPGQTAEADITWKPNVSLIGPGAGNTNIVNDVSYAAVGSITGQMRFTGIRFDSSLSIDNGTDGELDLYLDECDVSALTFKAGAFTLLGELFVQGSKIRGTSNIHMVQRSYIRSSSIFGDIHFMEAAIVMLAACHMSNYSDPGYGPATIHIDDSSIVTIVGSPDHAPG